MTTTFYIYQKELKKFIQNRDLYDMEDNDRIVVVQHKNRGKKKEIKEKWKK